MLVSDAVGLSSAGTLPAHSLSETLAVFMHDLELRDIPSALISHSKLLILDVLGVALASSKRDFAAVLRHTLAGGNSPLMASVIGEKTRLPMRDAALINGVLVHGLDFDDSFMPGIVHPSAISLPTALAVGEAYGRDGGDILTAYIGGLEVACRLGLAVGGLQGSGFHSTSIIGHFVSALVAGKLAGLSPSQMVSAQGIAASTTSGLKVYLEEGAWSKRLHAGWASNGGITAAMLAQSGFFGPSRPFEGRFGLFETLLGSRGRQPDLEEALTGLADSWKASEIAVKPYPICHYIHGCAEAAIEHHVQHHTPLDEIERVVALAPPAGMTVVCEPKEAKVNASSEYEVKFSTQHVVARGLLSGRFTLADLTEEAVADPQVRELATRVTCQPDPESSFPQFCSGGVIVYTRSGRVHKHHIDVNLGAGDRQMGSEDVTSKFMHSAALSLDPQQIQAVLTIVSNWENERSASIIGAIRGQ